MLLRRMKCHSSPNLTSRNLGAPLLALEYDPPGKGNAIILSSGETTVDYQHTVTAPVEMSKRLNADGSLDALEILDVEGVRTRLNFLN